MGPRLSERQWAVVFVAVLIVSIAALYAATLAIQPPVVAPRVVQAVHLEIEGPAWTIRHDPASTSNNTAFALLLEASVHLDFLVRYRTYQIPQGVFVTEINGSSNGDGGRYWQYWVNGAYAVVAADHAGLRDGDFVAWRFVGSQEGA